MKAQPTSETDPALKNVEPDKDNDQQSSTDDSYKQNIYTTQSASPNFYVSLTYWLFGRFFQKITFDSVYILTFDKISKFGYS